MSRKAHISAARNLHNGQASGTIRETDAQIFADILSQLVAGPLILARHLRYREDTCHSFQLSIVRLSTRKHEPLTYADSDSGVESSYKLSSCKPCRLKARCGPALAPNLHIYCAIPSSKPSLSVALGHAPSWDQCFPRYPTPKHRRKPRVKLAKKHRFKGSSSSCLSGYIG